MKLATDSAFKLGDLLDDSELGLELSTGGDVARERPVAGAHSIEVPRPARWLETGWIMLTTGMELKGSSRRQKELVPELCDAGVSALGFGVGVVWDEVPEPLLGAADKAGFPIFTIPKEKPFREVARVVERSVLVEEARTFRRLCMMQRFLIDALATAEPDAEIIDRLISLLDSKVALVDRSGASIVGRCAIDGDALAAHLAQDPAHPSHLDADDVTAWTFPVAGPESDRSGWLVIGARSTLSPHLVKQSAQIAVPILEAVGRVQTLTLSENRRIRSAGLDALIDSREPQEAMIAGARVALWGVHCERGVKVAIARLRAAVDGACPDLLREVEGALTDAGFAWLATDRHGEVHVLVGSEVSDQQLEEALIDLHPDLLVGIGREVTDPLCVQSSDVDAELALRKLEGDGPDRLLAFEALDLSASLVAEVDPDRMRQKVDRWLAPVRENPIVYEAMVAYLDNDLDVSRTSRVLNLHPNSTRYRLARLEELLGAPLRRPSTIAALHFALLADQSCAPHIEAAV